MSCPHPFLLSYSLCSKCKERWLKKPYPCLQCLNLVSLDWIESHKEVSSQLTSRQSHVRGEILLIQKVVHPISSSFPLYQTQILEHAQVLEYSRRDHTEFARQAVDT